MTSSAARSPSAQAPPTVPHCGREVASPANQIRSPTGSRSVSRIG